MPTATPVEGAPHSLALIGAGPWGRNYVRTFDDFPGARLSVVCSRNPETAGLVSKGTRIEPDWRRGLAEPGLDGVIIAAPPALHAGMMDAAFDLGLPVMVEKPMVLDLSEAERLHARATAEAIPVVVDHVHLFQPGYAALKELSRDLGPVRAICSRGGSLGPFRRPTPALWDWGPHDVALCLDLKGETPAHLEATVREGAGTNGQRGEVFEIEMTFEDGVRARIETGNGFEGRERRLEAVTDFATLVLDDNAEHQLVRRDTASGAETPVPVSPERPLARAVAAFAAAIRGEAAEHTGTALGLDVVRVLAACDAQISAADRAGVRGRHVV